LEYQNPEKISVEITEAETFPGSGQKQKNLYMKGIFIQGDVRNANQRIYPYHEIKKAVDTINEQIRQAIPIFGQLDHPDDLKISLDRVSHVITEMWMEGADGYGKLKILPTPMGNIIKSILESGVKLGVSSRGSGNVNESTGHVSDFEIITVDAVAQPSAPNAWPKPIYESMMNAKYGSKAFEIAREVNTDKAAQKFIKQFMTSFIKDLKL
jgi:hypothetical protein